MPKICEECGNHIYFKGWTMYREEVTYNSVFNEIGEIVNNEDRELEHSELLEKHIERCNQCDSEKIVNLTDVQFEQWKREHFDNDGKFIKKAMKTGESEIKGTEAKIKLMDDFLSNKISVEEFRKRKITV